jgi:protein disulfide isomerase family A protein 3
MRKVAVDFEEKAIFNVANKNDFEDVLERGYGLELPDRNDVGVGLRDGTNYYKMTTKFSTDNVRAFVESWSRGELVGLEQQQAEMEHNDGGEEYSGPSSVVTLTNSNFKKEVTDSDRDIMVEFYAPWCGHCKNLKPEYDNASNQLKDVESVMLGAFDASEDSPPEGFDVQGFPTLYFVPGDKSSPVPYEGAREAKSIVKFIQEHASTPFTL